MKRLEDMTEPELRDLMNTMGRAIECVAVDEFGVEKPLFALLLFNDPKVAQWMSNCQRGDVIAAMRETADRLERNQDVTR